MGENYFWGKLGLWLQYLEWPLVEEKSPCYHIASLLFSSYSTSMGSKQLDLTDPSPLPPNLVKKKNHPTQLHSSGCAYLVDSAAPGGGRSDDAGGGLSFHGARTHVQTRTLALV